MACVNTFSTYSIVFIILTRLVNEAEPKWLEDTIKTDSDWVFITRFCFLSKIGNLNYHLEYPAGYGPESFAFYYDVPGQWSSVYQRDLTCNQKVDLLNGKNQMTLDDSYYSCRKEKRQGQDWYVCQGDMDFSTARERWWFVVLTRCGPPANASFKGMYLYYKLHMTNGDDLLQKEFSADEFYILVIDIVFFILYIILLMAAGACAGVLAARKLLHTTYKMFLCALTIWTIHLLLMVIAWGHYGTTGWEIRPVEVAGRVLQTCSNVVFILMLILLAKGYTVVRVRLTTKAVIKITVFINLYIIAMVVMFIWEGALFDPGLVLYYYESPPGYGMITVILIGWLWFTKAAVFTLKHYTKKTIFYVAFYSFYTIWFWASPFVVLIAMFAMAKWTREKTVNGVQQFIAFLAHVVFLVLTLPHNANDNFPYHIRTTQIASMTDGNDYSEPNNGYASRLGDTFTSQGPNLDIFITSRGYSEGTQDQRTSLSQETGSTGSSVSILSRMQQSKQEEPPPIDINHKNAKNGSINLSHNPDQLNSSSTNFESRRPGKLPSLEQTFNNSSNSGEHPPIRSRHSSNLKDLPPIRARDSGNLGDLSPIRARDSVNLGDLSPIRARDSGNLGDLSPIRARDSGNPGDLPPIRARDSGNLGDLPPIRARDTGDLIDLPPIRASGLPTLLSSDASVDNDQAKSTLARRASLFQVS